MSGEVKLRGTSEIELRPLRGRNPRGLFAALGALDVVPRQLSEQCPTLRFTDSIEPHAVITGPRDLDHRMALADPDRARWEHSPILDPGPRGAPRLDDLKPRAESELPAWIGAVAEPTSVDDRADVDLLAGLVSEGALAGKGDASRRPSISPQATGGPSRRCELRSAIGPEDLREALGGPWR